MLYWYSTYVGSSSTTSKQACTATRLYETENKFREQVACDGIKEVREPMQGIFSVSTSNKRTDSADSSGTLVGLVYMLHEQVRPS
jgi:hypothetical protein